MKTRFLTLLLLFSALFIVLISCHTESETVLEEGSFKLVQTQIFDKSCATSGCHSSEQDASYQVYVFWRWAGLLFHRNC